MTDVIKKPINYSTQARYTYLNTEKADSLMLTSSWPILGKVNNTEIYENDFAVFVPKQNI